MGAPNSLIAAQFNLVADLLEIQGANPFRVRAYRNAARIIENWPTSLSATLAREGKLPKIPGAGADLAGKIEEIIHTGKFSLLEELARRMPRGIAELLRVPGLGPKRVLLLSKELGIQSLEELERAARQGNIRKLPGMGEKTEAKILQALRRFSAEPERFRFHVARQSAEPLLEYLREHPKVDQAVIAGSYRRQRETVGDIDILATTRAPTDSRALMRHFLAYEEITEALASGPTRSTARLRSGIQVDLRVVPKTSYGAALHYFTGSKAHNIAVRGMGVRLGLKINEYGVFRKGSRIAGVREEEVFKSVGLPWIPPELRENQGEIEAAAAGTLPKLVELSDLRGDLHSHTQATDGHASLQNMVEQTRKNGLEYLGITDHSKKLAMTRGFTPRRLLQQLQKIDEMNSKLKGFRILKSIEVDILEDGTLDLPDSILSQLDYTVCSIHSKFDLSARAQTERVLRAMKNPYFTILGHPSGRLIPSRPAYGLEMEKILRAARDLGCFLEVNSQPERLDLTATHCRLAKDLGVKVAISTDAHSERELSYLTYGIAQARRGWLEARDILNTRGVKEFLSLTARNSQRDREKQVA